MKLVLLVGAGILLVGTAQLGSAHTGAQAFGSHLHPPTSVSSMTGTAISVPAGGSSGLVILRSSASHVTTITLGGASFLVTKDGRPLRVSALRLGDVLTIQADGRVEDNSQQEATVQGIVAYVPQTVDDPVVVEVNPSSAITVDAGTHTRYADVSGETSDVSQLQDADEVKIQGIFDSTLGEMTAVTSVARLGPFHTDLHTTSAHHA